MKLFPMIRIIISIAFACIVSLGQAQDSSAVKTTNYYKIEVGIIIDCPVLPMSLHDKLIGLKGIKDFKKDQASQSITFNIPEGVITIEQIKNMATGCSFPPSYVNISMDNKPFTKK